MTEHRRQLTHTDVRRLAITRQHLGGAPPPPMLDLIRDLGCLQLDPISTVERSHLLVLWSRLGHFDHDALDTLLWGQQRLFEYWAHAASIVMTDEYPLHNWYMRQHAADPAHRNWLAERELLPLLDHVQDLLRTQGAMLSRDMQDDGKDPRREDHPWFSSRYVPRVLDYLWRRGDVMVVGRQGKQRVWGLAEQYLPEWTPRATWDDAQVTRYAAQRAVRALGAATPKQMKYHYTRGRYPNLPAVLDALVFEGVLERVHVVDDAAALPGEWYLHTDDIPLLEQIRAGAWQPQTTLLSPFDNLICDRERTELLFDFRYRIEIYTPAEKREYGYYVLPILHGDRLIGRIDPRMDRKTGTLHINAVYAEKDAPTDAPAVLAIRASVESLAGFLGAEDIAWGDVPRGWMNLL